MISVIVSVYQQPLTLGWLLESLSRQDYRICWEVLLSDDGSDPEVLSVVQDASRRYPIDIRYIWQPDAGFRLSRARNNAIRCAQGDLLVFLDGDMIVRPDFLSGHAAFHDGDRRILCGTREWMIFDDDPLPRDIEEIYSLSSRQRDDPRDNGEASVQAEWAESSSPWMALMGANFSVPNRPEVIFDEQFYGWGPEDRELACRLSRNHAYQFVVSEAVEGIHIGLPSKPATLGPLWRNDHNGIVELIRNKLMFRRLHPDVDITPLLEMFQNCFVDPSTDTWHYDPQPKDIDLDKAIELAEVWMDAHGFSYKPISAAG